MFMVPSIRRYEYRKILSDKTKACVKRNRFTVSSDSNFIDFNLFNKHVKTEPIYNGILC